MAKRKSRRMPKIAPAITDLFFTADVASQGDSRSYIDTAKELSKVNRRLYEQGRMYAYQGLSFIFKPVSDGSLASLEVRVKTAGNTWIVHNAFVKGKALWHEMQDLVLEDNPSIRGKWADYKVTLSTSQTNARTLAAQNGGADVAAGEWNYAQYVMPQHDVDPATGLPLAADEFSVSLIGDDGATRRSLVKAYQESRATVQPIDPNVPAGMSTSFFNLLTDSGSQEPELADLIEDENDQPPYDADNYPGGDTNAIDPFVVGFDACTSFEVDGRIGPFIAPCGLLEIQILGYQADGTPVANADMPAIDLLLHVAPGTYKGVAAIPMGQ